MGRADLGADLGADSADKFVMPCVCRLGLDWPRSRIKSTSEDSQFFTQLFSMPFAISIRSHSTLIF